VVPPCTAEGDRQDVIHLARLACASWSFDLASVPIALEYLEAYLAPGSLVPRFPSHASRLWLASSRGLSRCPTTPPPPLDGSLVS
jgi:hypothetical protein